MVDVFLVNKEASAFISLLASSLLGYPSWLTYHFLKVLVSLYFTLQVPFIQPHPYSGATSVSLSRIGIPFTAYLAVSQFIKGQLSTEPQFGVVIVE